MIASEVKDFKAGSAITPKPEKKHVVEAAHCGDAFVTKEFAPISGFPTLVGTRPPQTSSVSIRPCVSAFLLRLLSRLKRDLGGAMVGEPPV